MYEPEVGDYVKWHHPHDGSIDQGWVYFKGDPVNNSKRKADGWNPISQYITIETGVRPKPNCEYAKNDKHRYIHTLLICNQEDWNQLEYIKNRRDTTRDATPENISTDMYKSQENRYSDPQ